jgi:2-aminoadipate transaminase
VTLPARVNAMSLLARAIENNVSFVPGEDFHVDGTGQNTMRLNFSNANPANIRAGIERLAKVIKSAL